MIKITPSESIQTQYYIKIIIPYTGSSAWCMNSCKRALTIVGLDAYARIYNCPSQLENWRGHYCSRKIYRKFYNSTSQKMEEYSLPTLSEIALGETGEVLKAVSVLGTTNVAVE